MQRMYSVMQQVVNTTHRMVGETQRMVSETHEMVEITHELRDHLADFDDFWRPLRNYFYWEPHCFDIPICWSSRSLFDAMDGVDQISDKFDDLVKDLDQVVEDFDQIDVLLPQMIAEFPPMIETMEGMRTMMLTMHSTMSGIFNQMEDMGSTPPPWGRRSTHPKTTTPSIFLRNVFQNNDFKRAMNLFLSPDGKAVRMIISQRGDSMTPEGISRIGAINTAAEEMLKGTPLENAKIYVTGMAAISKDLVDGSKYDLMIAGIAALCHYFHHHADHHAKF